MGSCDGIVMDQSYFVRGHDSLPLVFVKGPTLKCIMKESSLVGEIISAKHSFCF